jgi:hypothetical protein
MTSEVLAHLRAYSIDVQRLDPIPGFEDVRQALADEYVWPESKTRRTSPTRFLKMPGTTLSIPQLLD